ncbi:MAG: tyrosine-type recombinase/integrase [Candidatus Hydrogenedentes bacterium]|nr:tyrosine-type recombinase/integrase [Candidatus Hydrogenedentota bacterium]
MASVYRRKGPNGRPEKVWRFKFKDVAGRWRYGTGWPDKQKTLHHALEVEADQRAIRKGEKIVLPRPASEADHALSERIAAYLKWGRTQGGKDGRPWDEQNAALKEGYLDWWVDELGLKSLVDIRLDKVERVAQDLLSGGHYAPKSVALRIEALKSLCLWAVRRGYLPSNPLAGLAKIDTRPRDPHRAFNENEVASLLGVAPPQRRLWYEVALATGYRVSELRALRVRDLDLSRPSLPLAADYTKNRKNARQPITQELAERLRSNNQGRPEEAPLLDIPGREAWAPLKEDLSAAGIVNQTPEGKATWHSFRKAFVNSLVRSGADLKTIMELARHSTASLSMEVYASADDARLRRAVEAATKHLDQDHQASPCCKYVAGDSSSATQEDIKKDPEGPYDELVMVGDTGLEPVTSAV